MSTAHNHSKHLTKVGNAFVTSDLRFYLKRRGSGWVLFDRRSDETRLAVMSTKTSALRIADDIITATLEGEQTA